MTQTTGFNPNEHLTQLKSKQGSQDYLEVKWRMVWFRDRYPNGTIDTEEVEVDLDRVVEAEAFVWNAEKRRSEKVIKQAKGYARFRAVVTNGEGGRATGTKSESAANFPDFIEKAETGAIGRALAGIGFGTQFTGEELYEGERLADAPVERAPGASQHNGNGSRPSAENEANTKATEQQIDALRKLYTRAGMGEPENMATMSHLEAKQLIHQISAEIKQQSQQPAQSSPATEQQERNELYLKVTKRVKLFPELNWGSIKRDCELAHKRDSELTIADLATIDGKVSEMEQRMMAPAK